MFGIGISFWKRFFGIIVYVAALVVSIGVILYHCIFFVNRLLADERTIIAWVVVPVIYGITSAAILLLIIEHIFRGRLQHKKKRKEEERAARARSINLSMHEMDEN